MLESSIELKKGQSFHRFFFTDYGRPMKPFSSNSQTFGHGQTNWADKFWDIWGIFELFMSTHFGTVSTSTVRLYVQIPNIHLGLGF